MFPNFYTVSTSLQVSMSFWSIFRYLQWQICFSNIPNSQHVNLTMHNGHFAAHFGRGHPFTSKVLESTVKLEYEFNQIHIQNESKKYLKKKLKLNNIQIFYMQNVHAIRLNHSTWLKAGSYFSAQTQHSRIHSAYAHTDTFTVLLSSLYFAHAHNVHLLLLQ